MHLSLYSATRAAAAPVLLIALAFLWATDRLAAQAEPPSEPPADWTATAID